MRWLANENFPGDAVRGLQGMGHDVFWVRTQMPGARDVAVLAKAAEEARVLLTFDKDFGELAFRAGLPAECGIILLRLRASSAEVLAKRIVAAIESRKDWQGHFSVVEPSRIRIRQLPGTSP